MITRYKLLISSFIAYPICLTRSLKLSQHSSRHSIHCDLLFLQANDKKICVIDEILSFYIIK
jgi:hypothetical protein